jgi:hypothetical protein
MESWTCLTSACKRPPSQIESVGRNWNEFHVSAILRVDPLVRISFYIRPPHLQQFPPRCTLRVLEES